MTRRRYTLLCCFLGVLILGLSACGGHKARVRFPIEQYQAYVKEGNQFFEKGHLWGWRQADERYEKAWSMAKSDELLEHRVVCLALQATRERDELIFDSGVREKIAGLGPFTSPKLRLLQALATGYGQTKPPLPADLTSVPFETIFDSQNSDADAYLFLLCLKTFRPEKQQEVQVALEEKHNQSNIFRYSAPLGNIDEILQADPDFAELRLYRGHLCFQNAELTKAREHFETAAKLLPDHAEAVNSLGDVYLFGFRDQTKALEQYEAALRIDSDNIKALFGKGLIFHYQGKYGESSRLLDTLLQQQPGWEYLGETQRQYYRGQAYYYKAYNAYLSDDLVNARRWVDTAKGYVPNFGGVYYLSGLLHFRLREMDYAERDFLRALEDGREYCDAPYYLGLIDRARQGDSVSAYFLACGDCYRTSLKELRKRIADIPKIDITEAEKQVLRGKLEHEVTELGQTAGKILVDILRILPQIEFEGKELQTQLLTEVSEELNVAAATGSHP